MTLVLTRDEAVCLVSTRRVDLFRPAVVDGQLSKVNYTYIGFERDFASPLVETPLPILVRSVMWRFAETPDFTSGWTVGVEMTPPSPDLLVDLVLALAETSEDAAIDALYSWFLDEWVALHGAKTLDVFLHRGMSQSVVVLLAPLAITVLTRDLVGESRVRLYHAVRAELVRRETPDLAGLLAGLEP